MDLLAVSSAAQWNGGTGKELSVQTRARTKQSTHNEE